MNQNWLLFAYCIAVIGSSLLGGAIPSFVRLTHVRMQCLLSLVGGFVLGVALLHMIPHGAIACQSLDLVILWTLIGLLFTFFLIRIFHFHQHGPEAQPVGGDTHECANPDHDHNHDHDHDHDQKHSKHQHVGRDVSWIGVLLGLALHTLMDGVAMGAAFFTDARLHGGDHALAWPYGFGVFLAVFLHKPLDALSITGLMTNGKWSDIARRRVNLGFALMCPLGAVLFIGCTYLATDAAALTRFMGIGLGFSAGAFLCISLSDLLPEVQFHRHDRGKLSFSLLLGVALAYGIGFLEGGHTHSHDPSSNSHVDEVHGERRPAQDETNHAGHDHAKHEHTEGDH